LLRRIASVAIASAAVLAAYGCGANGNDTSVRSGRNDAVSVRPADSPIAGAAAHTVEYRGVEFDVPADWPVYDLAANPTTCVRFDVHAVYVGQPSADMSCPATVIGRADAVLIEPEDDGWRAGRNSTSGPAAVSADSVNGLQAEVADGGTVTNEVEARFPGAGVSARFTYQDSAGTVQEILHSFRGASR
jgi:hypothetical protein